MIPRVFILLVDRKAENGKRRGSNTARGQMSQWYILPGGRTTGNFFYRCWTRYPLMASISNNEDFVPTQESETVIRFRQS